MKIYDLPVMGYDRAKVFMEKRKLSRKTTAKKSRSLIIQKFARSATMANLSVCGTGTVLPQCAMLTVFFPFSVFPAVVNRGGIIKR